MQRNHVEIKCAGIKCAEIKRKKTVNTNGNTLQ